MTLTVTHHFVLDVKLEFFVVDSLLNLVQVYHVFETETLCWLVLDQGLENLAAAFLSWSTDRSQLLDVEDLLFYLETHHAGMCGFCLTLRRKLYMYCAFEFACDWILDYVDVFDGAKDLTDLLDHC